ncbi:MAG: NAD-dependent epimerase/dehydratase family protein [Bdellovibrio sp.]
MSNVRLLITGASGFLGKTVLRTAASQGVTVLGVGRRKLPDFQGLYQAMDLENSEARQKLLQDFLPTHVLHLAWFVEHGDFWESSSNIDSMQMSLGFFEEFATTKGVRFIGVGTCAEYDWCQPGPFSETAALKPDSLYGLTKKALFEILSHRAIRQSVSFAWARIFYPFGPGESPKKLIPLLIKHAQAGQPLRLGPGTQKKDFIYVEDAATALLALVQSDVKGAINVGTGRGTSIREISAVVDELCSVNGLWQWGAQGAGRAEPDFLVAETQRLREEVMWVPRYDLKQSLAAYLQQGGD